MLQDLGASPRGPINILVSDTKFFTVAAWPNSNMPTCPPRRGGLDEYMIYFKKKVEIGDVGKTDFLTSA